eukprot:CAMPEP_0185733714 /NCGR_PEP_ID=MMETSP1171-20130828/20366_1 /TAXON_ID=374046 /ORGANISM="Helicotheca tamensis, Strain CCMP826" /LENGTH=548 /DNA_ID=CAMNT_0028403513 /DNA_START=55 /DNA_END=1697 /DNA_ORIENTATION=+
MPLNEKDVPKIQPGDEDWHTPVHTIESIVRSKRASALDGVCHDIPFRKQQISNIIRMIEENSEDLAKAVYADLGQTDFFVDVMDTKSVIPSAKNILRNMDEWTKMKKVPTNFPVNIAQPVFSCIEPTPRGLVLVISPWNFPFYCSVLPIIEAISAGNVCILKPSEVSVHSSKILSELLPQYVDERVVSIVNGGVPQATEVLKHRFDAIMYTGSTYVGKIVAAAAAKHLTPICLELGGKNPVFVCDDADIECASLRIAWAKYTGNTGQMCVTNDYVIVVEHLRKKFVDAVIKHILQFYGADPRKSKDYGRIVLARHVERLADLMDDPTITVLHGGKYDVEGRYFEPTVVDATAESKCMKEEIFGPILPIFTVPNVESGVKFVRDNFTSKGQHPLSLYVFCKNQKTWKYIADSIPSGGVTVNDTVKNPGNWNLPFGGVGTSGMGAYHGHHGFTFFSHMKSFLVTNNLSSSPYDPSVWVIFPPYTDAKMTMLKAIIKLPDIWFRMENFIMYVVMPVFFLVVAYKNPGLVDAVREFNINTIIMVVGSFIDWA